MHRSSSCSASSTDCAGCMATRKNDRLIPLTIQHRKAKEKAQDTFWELYKSLSLSRATDAIRIGDDPQPVRCFVQKEDGVTRVERSTGSTASKAFYLPMLTRPISWWVFFPLSGETPMARLPNPQLADQLASPTQAVRQRRHYRRRSSVVRSNAQSRRFTNGDGNFPNRSTGERWWRVYRRRSGRTPLEAKLSNRRLR